MFSTTSTPIADSLASDGYYIGQQQIPAALVAGLRKSAAAEEFAGFQRAGIGRGSNHQTADTVRRDHVRWIHGADEPEQQWLAFAETMRLELNRSLFLGLQSFESHFARYQSGDFYRRHRDAFKKTTPQQHSSGGSPDGTTNRAVSIVAYLNNDWSEADGGELLLYPDDDSNPASQRPLQRILPTAGTFCVFFSEQFPHEVLPAHRERLSIAGWFRR